MGSTEFFDADFATALTIKCDYFDQKSLSEVNKLINDTLESSGYLGEMLNVGKLKDIDDFNLGDVLVRSDIAVTVRFNSF